MKQVVFLSFVVLLLCMGGDRVVWADPPPLPPPTPSPFPTPVESYQSPIPTPSTESVLFVSSRPSTPSPTPVWYTPPSPIPTPMSVVPSVVPSVAPSVAPSVTPSVAPSFPPSVTPAPHPTPVQSFQSHAVQSSLSPVIVHGGSELITAHDWQPFEVRGVNYLRTTVDDPNRCAELQFGVDGNCGWNRQAIERDMDVLQSLGVNTVRVFLNFYAFGGSALISPSPTSSSDMAVAIHHLEQFITIANNRGIYVMPVLIAKYPQDRFTADDLKTVLDIHVHPIINYFSGHNGILAWDLFNEPDIAGPVDVRCWDWDNNEFPLCAQIATQRMLFLNVLRDEVKRLDPHKPLTISVAFAKSYFRPAGVYAVPLAELVDFYAIHYYDNDPYDSGRYAQHWYYGEGFPRDFERSIDELRAMGLGKPVVFTEVGFPSGDDAKRTLAEAQQDLRTARDTVRAKEGNGVILWPFQPDPRDLIHTLFE